MVDVDYALRFKEEHGQPFSLKGIDFCLIRAPLSFLALLFYSCFVSGVCKGNTNSYMVPILSKTPSPTDQISLKG
jgi:hypothetical protein